MPTPLLVLKNSDAGSSDQLIRLFHQSQLDWFRHLGEETELDFGRLISLPDFDCLLDAHLVPGTTPADLFAKMSDRPWQCCTVNPSMERGRTAPITEALLEDGWTAWQLDILYRRQIAQISPSAATSTTTTPPNTTPRQVLKIIPARAGFRHYRQLMEQKSPGMADRALLHLDDPHFDALLALKAGQPVGSIGVLTGGEVGTVREWFVPAEHRSTGIGRLLLARAMEICLRGTLRHVIIGLPDSAAAPSAGPASACARRLAVSAGFADLGKWTVFWKDSCKSRGIFA